MNSSCKHNWQIAVQYTSDEVDVFHEFKIINNEAELTAYKKAHSFIDALDNVKDWVMFSIS
jgi:hypothetical protein